MILETAKALIEDPKHWIQEDYAADENGDYVTETDPKAFAWCALGAFTKASGGFAYNELAKLERACLSRAANRISGYGVTCVNDTLGHEKVMEMYDVAIQIRDERMKDNESLVGAQ